MLAMSASRKVDAIHNVAGSFFRPLSVTLALTLGGQLLL